MSDLHLGELRLREWMAQDLSEDAARTAAAHVEACDLCRTKWHAVLESQRTFEAEIPFARFEQGVLRAARHPEHTVRRPWQAMALAAAAGVVLTLTVQPLLEQTRSWPPSATPNRIANRIKGGPELIVRIASLDGAQREAPVDTPAPLAPGDRVRLGYVPGEYHYVAALSVDVSGEVTALYPASGMSLPVEQSRDGVSYLPGSLEFTGTGAERVVLVLSEHPLAVEDLRREATEAFLRADKDVKRFTPLEVPGAQFHQLLLKP